MPDQEHSIIIDQCAEAAKHRPPNISVEVDRNISKAHDVKASSRCDQCRRRLARLADAGADDCGELRLRRARITRVCKKKLGPRWHSAAQVHAGKARRRWKKQWISIERIDRDRRSRRALKKRRRERTWLAPTARTNDKRANHSTIAGGGESSHQFKGLGIAEEPSFGRRKMGLNTRVIARILQRRPRRFLRAAHATLNGARDQHHSQSLE